MTDPMTARVAYARGVETFDGVLTQVGEDQWASSTPCTEWDVRALVNHVVGEDRWMVPLLEGRTVADVGDALDGDLLGDDPLAAWRAARDDAAAAVANAPDDQVIALSAGPTPLAEYLWQLAADHLIHAWDLATAVGVALAFDDDLAGAVEDWFTAWEDGYREAGAIAARVAVPGSAGRQERLLAAFGRRPVRGTAAVVAAFTAAFNSRELDEIMAWATPDCVFESTTPPDGQRHEGQVAVRAAWQQLFSESAMASFREESAYSFGNRAVVQWRYDWQGDTPGHVRGVDLFRVQDGLVAEKVSYVKG